MSKNIFFLSLFASTLTACVETNITSRPDKSAAAAAHFALPTANPNNYWYQGKAELSTYNVEQERYGEMRNAEQVNIFVTEDFSKSKQVKLDDPAAAATDRCPILKLNSVRRFRTGIYDYSIMSSVFTPMDKTATLKTTYTIQDWCGHAFAQNNLKSPGQWHSQLFSYFESEGDQQADLKADLLEDEIWTKLRMDPNTIQKGKLKVVPSAIYLRLRHKPLQPEDAIVEVQNIENESVVSLKYTSIDRSLTIRAENAAPWRILGWEEQIGGKIASKGNLKALMMEPYWQQNSNAYSSMRDSLKLHF